jgi:hypothetical protein
MSKVTRFSEYRGKVITVDENGFFFAKLGNEQLHSDVLDILHQKIDQRLEQLPASLAEWTPHVKIRAHVGPQRITLSLAKFFVHVTESGAVWTRGWYGGGIQRLDGSLEEHCLYPDIEKTTTVVLEYLRNVLGAYHE